MYGETIIFPLDGDGKIYAIQDEKGKIIGTGTREVCEMLLYIITTGLSVADPNRVESKSATKANIRSAISM